ncbi:MAG: YebC/PmpR family DNA-binding transcriptional regulator [Clostridia bacterium]|nr:YebC/PmpR family DNA-binding transcriptional regulator [Clostridia bacterium]
MSGHSKWNNIKRKKEATDAKRAKVFTKIGREIAVCVKAGGPDPVSNSALRDLIAKAKSLNVPNDNIMRTINKYSSGGGEDYESITYEGYGPGGAAVIVETMTDNRNRTASDMRHYFDKFGGNLGASNCVSWQFDRKGVLLVEREDQDEDEFMMIALEAGADDFAAEEESFEIITSEENFEAVRDALAAQGIEFADASVQMIPQNYVSLNEEQLINMQKLIDMLEDNDDVQEIWHNCDNI